MFLGFLYYTCIHLLSEHIYLPHSSLLSYASPYGPNALLLLFLLLRAETGAESILRVTMVSQGFQTANEEF